MSRSRPPLPAGFGAIWSTVAIDLIGFGMMLPVLPLYAERFDASPTAIGLLVATFSLAQFVCSPILGRLSDRIGRKPVLVVSLFGTAAGSLITGLAPGLAVLFVGRVIDGISGASVSVAQAAVTDLAPRDQRARLLGLLSAAFGVGFVAGPALGSLAALGGPQVPFLLAAAVAATNAIVAIRRLPETRPVRLSPATRGDRDQPQPMGALRVVLLAVAFSSLCAFSSFEATFALFVTDASDSAWRQPGPSSPAPALSSPSPAPVRCTPPSAASAKPEPFASAALSTPSGSLRSPWPTHGPCLLSPWPSSRPGKTSSRQHSPRWSHDSHPTAGAARPLGPSRPPAGWPA